MAAPKHSSGKHSSGKENFAFDPTKPAFIMPAHKIERPDSVISNVSISRTESVSSADSIDIVIETPQSAHSLQSSPSLNPDAKPFSIETPIEPNANVARAESVSSEDSIDTREGIESPQPPQSPTLNADPFSVETLAEADDIATTDNMPVNHAELQTPIIMALQSPTAIPGTIATAPITHTFWYQANAIAPNTTDIHNTITSFAALRAARYFGTCSVLAHPGILMMAVHMHALKCRAFEEPENMLTLDSCIFFANDVLLFSADKTEHQRHLKCLLEMLTLSNLDVNEAKTKGFVNSADKLGFGLRDIETYERKEFAVPHAEDLERMGWLTAPAPEASNSEEEEIPLVSGAVDYELDERDNDEEVTAQHFEPVEASEEVKDEEEEEEEELEEEYEGDGWND
ncbi:hypothetical protein BT63DRAFT_182406 [Microthyrium microscopicum]|uniref:Reverse transcriptase domain-containing protein n=1 Tax=Microthyrium microscopicum TaxID=703497 RepID=A0A6A6UK54_9PEZI|nr:hypothetical protein BT63DRAFT_182406 [Microthyrium microscopicum]